MASIFDVFPEGKVPVKRIVASTFIIYVLVRIITYVRSYYRDRKISYTGSCLPPPTYPHSDGVLGIAHISTFIKAGRQHRLLTMFNQIFADVGPSINTISHYTLGDKAFWTQDPENIKAILATNFKDWELPARRKRILSKHFGSGIFSADGQEWEHARAMLRPNFNRAQVGNLPALEVHVSNLLARIPNRETVDLGELFPLLTLDFATELLFGQSTGSLDPSSESVNANEFASAFDYTLNKLEREMRLPVLALLPDKKLKKSVKYINDFISRYVDRAFEMRKHAQVSEEENDEAFGNGKSKKPYVFLEELAKSSYGVEKIKIELLSIMVAGRDTTAGLLTVMWWNLVRRPDVVRRLRNELEFLDGRPPTWEELKNLRYLKWVINETLRLYPIAPINARTASCDTMLPSGGGHDGRSPVFIRAGQRVIFVVSAMQRRKDLFGEDANEFRPERWETLRTGWEYIPFSGGPRICIGQQLALTEASYTTVRLLQEFKNIEPRSSGPFLEGLSLVLTSVDGCKVALSKN